MSDYEKALFLNPKMIVNGEVVEAEYKERPYRKFQMEINTFAIVSLCFMAIAGITLVALVFREALGVQ